MGVLVRYSASTFEHDQQLNFALTVMKLLSIDASKCDNYDDMLFIKMQAKLTRKIRYGVHLATWHYTAGPAKFTPAHTFFIRQQFPCLSVKPGFKRFPWRNGNSVLYTILKKLSPLRQGERSKRGLTIFAISLSYFCSMNS